MILPAILDPFASRAAPPVMIRLALDWMIARTSIDPLLESVAQGRYDREFLLSHFVEVMADVSCGFRPSPRAALLKRQFDRFASLSASYAKLGRIEPAISSAIVRRTADRARELIEAAEGVPPEPIPGYATRILDGNVLAGTDHRIDEPRRTRAATLPGKLLAIDEPISGPVRDVVLEEDAHTQERALLDRVAVESGQLRVMDRDFRARTFLFRILRAGAFFLVRGHASTLPFEPAGPLRTAGRRDTGTISEQPIDVADPECDGRSYRPRRIVSRLDQPTRQGEPEIVPIANPPKEIKAMACRGAYLGRWEIEVHFPRLTDLPHRETPELGCPRAASFAFRMSAPSGNALAILMGNPRAVHGDEMAAEVSPHALIKDLAEVYPGMMIAVPPSEWAALQSGPACELAGLMNDLAEAVPIERMLGSRRGPKKPRRAGEKPGGKIHHVATRKLLEASRGMPPPPTSARSKRCRVKG